MNDLELNKKKVGSNAKQKITQVISELVTIISFYNTLTITGIIKILISFKKILNNVIKNNTLNIWEI